MNAPARVDALVRELYRLKENLAEARYPPDPGDERRHDSRRADLNFCRPRGLSKKAGTPLPPARLYDHFARLSPPLLVLRRLAPASRSHAAAGDRRGLERA
jgi:hypothetical protein